MLVGARERLEVRLLAVRVPQEVADQRRLRAEMRDKGKTPSARLLALAAWTTMVTTVPEEQVRVKEALVLLRARWQLEVTFEEARAHLGVETQRQWSELAIGRTTPALLGLFALVSVLAHGLLQGQELPARSAAWYSKPLPTFSDTLALVRQELWPVSISFISPSKPDMVEIPRALFERLTDTLAFAA